ncbi:MAG: EAL domain-containing protein [Clostridia bacterium]|nr:EAL domain-containing protein [Clostridia bacterium]
MINRRNIKKIIFNGLVMSLTCLTMGVVIYFFVSQALVINVEESLTEIAKQGAKVVEEDIEGYLDSLEAIANMDQVRNEDIPLDEKLKLLEAEVKRKGLKRVSIADLKGNSKTTDSSRLYIGDREYFKRALEGRKSVSDPMISRVDGTMIVAYAVPIYNNQKITGILYASHDVETLSKIADDIRLGAAGTSFIVNKKGIIIAHNDRKLVHSMTNIQEESKMKPALVPLAALIRQMTEGKSGAGKYKFEGSEKYMGYAPIRGTEWSIAVSAPKSQVFRSVDRALIVIISGSLFMLIVFFMLSFYTGYLKKRLHQEQITSSNAIEAAHILIMRIEHSGKVVSINKHVENAILFSKEETVGKMTLFDMVPADFMKRAEELLELLKKENHVNNFELPLRIKGGNSAFILWNYSKEKNKIENANSFEIMGIDITDRAAYEEMLRESYEQLSASREELKEKYNELFSSKEQLKESEERFRLSAEGSNDILWNWDDKNKKMYFSERWYEALGYEIGEVEAGLNQWMGALHPEDRERVMNEVERHTSGETPSIACEYRLRTKNGDYKWFFSRGKALFDERGQYTKMAGSLTDITRQKEYERSILKLAYFDPLTGLPNRVSLEERFKNYVSEGKGNAALLYVDIDNFKFINDSYGHSTGDRVIVEVSKRLIGEIKEADIIIRQSGDEFTLLLIAVQGKQELIRCIEKIQRCFDRNIELGDMSFDLSASIGISVYPEDGEDLEQLSKSADTALYKAKDLGRGHYAFFEKAMNDAILERITLEGSLKKAIQQEEFVLYYQPQVNVELKKVIGFEALVRWNSPTMGFVSPAKFIGVAEESGLIVPLGAWILKAACGFMKKLVDAGYEDMKVSVNISVIQLVQEDFVGIVAEALHSTGLGAQYLNLEITETVLMESIESNLRKLEELRAMGVKISLDDFGKGYSSLTYLKQLPIDTLKIDKAFVDDIPDDNGITESIVLLAQKLGLSVIAEGVETRAQLDYLVKSNCSIIQGYLLSKPIPEKEVEPFIQGMLNI